MFKKTVVSLLVMIYAFVGLIFFADQAYAEENQTVNVNFTALFDENNQIPVTLEFQYGDSISIEDFDTPTYEFAFWVVNGFVDYTLEANTQFVVTKDLELIAVYHLETNYAVLFIDSNGKLLQTTYVDNTNTETVSAPDISGLDKPGYEVSTLNTWRAHDNRTTLDNIDTNLVYELQYTRLNNDTFTVAVTNGTATNLNPVYNEIVTVESTLEGFTHWEENGEVVSYDAAYKFTALRNRNLVAKTDGFEEPIITLTDDLGLRDNHESYMGQVYLPDTHILLETGLVVSEFYNPSLDLSSDDAVKIRSQAIHPETNEFLRTLDSNVYATIRGYLTYKFEENIYTTYSNINILKKHLGIVDDFEDTTLDEYTFVSGSVNAEKSFTSDSFDGNRALQWDLSQKTTGGAIFLDFLNSGKYQYINEFDEMVIRYKATYLNGQTYNISTSLSIATSDGVPIAGSTSQSVTFIADGTWRELTLSKNQTSNLFVSSEFAMFRMYANVFLQERGDLEIIFDAFEMKHIYREIIQNTTLNLVDEFNILTEDIVTATYQIGENEPILISNLETFKPLESGTLSLNLERTGFLETRFDVFILVTTEKSYTTFDNFENTILDKYKITIGDATISKTLNLTDNSLKAIVGPANRSSETHIAIGFNDWNNYGHYTNFDFIEFKVKASYIPDIFDPGKEPNLTFKINNTWAVVQQNNTNNRNIKADDTWKTVKLNKDQFSTAQLNNKLELQFTRNTGQFDLDLNIEIGEIKFGYNTIEVVENDSLNLYTYLGLGSSEVLIARYNDVEVSDLENFVATESGVLTIDIDVEGFASETLEINVEFTNLE